MTRQFYDLISFVTTFYAISFAIGVRFGKSEKQDGFLIENRLVLSAHLCEFSLLVCAVALSFLRESEYPDYLKM
jgi:hypothetical protein